MDLAPRIVHDLVTATDLYERRLCSLGVLRLAVERARDASRAIRPSWTAPLDALAEQAAQAEEAGAPWLDGMALVDRIRAWAKDPPGPEARVERAVEEGETAGALPEDASEPARPRLAPRTRRL